MEKKTQTTLMDFLGTVKKVRPDDFEQLLFDVKTEDVLRASDTSVISDYQQVVNADTNEVLSVTLKSYSPVSNKEIIEFFEKSMDEDGIRYEYGFSTQTRNGRKNVFEIILPDMTIDLGNGDTQELRLYVTNSFDGKTSVRLDMGFFRHACSNMALMIGSADIEYRTSHVGDAQDRVQTQFLHYVKSQYEAVTQFVETLSALSFETGEKITEFIESEDNTIVANRDRDKVQSAFHSYYRHTHKLSLWGVYNAYTHVITHDLNISEIGKMKKFLELSKTFKKMIETGNID